MYRRHSRKGSEDAKKPEDPSRLPLRWGFIILTSLLAAIAVGSAAGPALAIGTGLAVAVGLDQLLALLD